MEGNEERLRHSSGTRCQGTKDPGNLSRYAHVVYDPRSLPVPRPIATRRKRSGTERIVMRCEVTVSYE